MAKSLFDLHRTEADRLVHEKTGFCEGWGMALDQLLALQSAH